MIDVKAWPCSRCGREITFGDRGMVVVASGEPHCCKHTKEPFPFRPTAAEMPTGQQRFDVAVSKLGLAVTSLGVAVDGIGQLERERDERVERWRNNRAAATPDRSGAQGEAPVADPAPAYTTPPLPDPPDDNPAPPEPRMSLAARLNLGASEPPVDDDDGRIGF